MIEKYISFIQKENVKDVEFTILKDENQKKYIEGFLLRDGSDYKIVIIINENEEKELIEKELNKVRNLYGIKEVETVEDYIDFVFYHEWAHYLQYKEVQERSKNQKDIIEFEEKINKEYEELNELIKKENLTEEEKEKKYREISYERNADIFARKQLNKENKKKKG